MNLHASYFIKEVNEYIDNALKRSVEEHNIEKPDFKKAFTSINEFIEKRSTFKVDIELPEPEELNPLGCVIYNYFSRGIPTHCTSKCKSYLLSKYKLNFTENLDIDPREYLFGNEGNDVYLKNYNLLKLVEEPFKIGQLHKAFCYLCLYSTSNSIKIASNLLTSELLKVAVSEFNEIVNAFNKISIESFEKQIVITENENADFTINKSNFTQSSFTNQFLSTNAVDYKDYGKQVEDVNDNDEVISYFDVLDDEMDAGLKYILKQTFGFEEFKSGQQAIIRRILLGKDVIGLLPTGGGKSLCYQLCGLMQPGLTIIVDPINSLMKDQEAKLREYGINQAVFINSFLTAEERDLRLDNISQSKYLFLLISPERFHIPKYRNALLSSTLNGVHYHHVVIDEAHVVSEWGHDFRPSYLKLAFSINKLLAKDSVHRPVYIGLTATASFDVLSDVQRELSVDDNLRLANDAIATLPPDAINRSELSFKIIPCNVYNENNITYPRFYNREFELKGIKYPLLNDCVSKSHQKFGIELLSDDKYNAGIVIFCPTKSKTLPSGVNYMFDELKHNRRENEYVTFHGKGSNVVHEDPRVNAQALKSEYNQELFLDNRAKVMISTKAFGMGIDKQNIRSTIHYSMPSSVEAFYQEAGRAGRDGNDAKCFLLYDYHDVLMNNDFLENSFKTERKEYTVSNEICTKLKFEEGFKRRLLSNLISTEANIVVNLGQISNSGWIPLYGPYKEEPEERISFGALSIDSLRHATQFTQNVTNDEIEVVGKAIRKICKEYIAERNLELESYLRSTSDDGIIPNLLSLQDGESFSMFIPFVNDYISSLCSLLEENIPLGYNDDPTIFGKVLKWKRFVHRAFEFAKDGNDFLENLQYQFYRDDIVISTEMQKRIADAFYHIRSSNDTERAIYRLKQLGVIDDYVLDYKAMYFDITISKKPIAVYENKLYNYLRRYIAQKPAEAIMNDAKQQVEGEIDFLPYRNAMIDFVHTEIKSKRKKSIDYMYELCKKYQEQGEESFKTDVKYYFASKFSSSKYLPLDTDDGKKSSVDIVMKYLDFVYNPPNGLGGPINNFEHLKGACNRYLISLGTQKNASIQILNSTSTIAIDSSRTSDLAHFTNSERFRKAVNQLYLGYIGLIANQKNLEPIKKLLKNNIKLLVDFNNALEDELQNLNNLISAHFLLNKSKNIRLNQLI